MIFVLSIKIFNSIYLYANRKSKQNTTHMQKLNWLYVSKITLIASVGGFLFGYDASVISGAFPFMVDYFHLSPTMQGIAVGSVGLGAISGPLLGLYFTQRYGSRKIMLTAALLFIVSAIGCAVAFTIWDFIFWRAITGAGIGLAMMSSPIYIAELSPVHLRGRLVNINQLTNVLGINIAIVAAYFLSFPGWGWRWMMGSELVPAAILFIGLFFIPESPRWLIRKGYHIKGLQILTKINGEIQAKKELQEIQQGIEKEGLIVDKLLQPSYKKVFLIAIVLMIFSQINGVNVILTYAPTILENAGFSKGTDAILNSIPIYVFILITTILSFWLINRFSRRGLLITSILLMAIGHMIMAIVLQLHLPSMYILIPMLISTGAFTLGFAPLSWIIVSEIFPNRIRNKGLAIVCSFLFLSTFFANQTFPMLTHWFSKQFGQPAGVYWVFFGICLACVFFSYKMVPETKGLSLEQISELWQEKSLHKKDALGFELQK